MRIDMRDRAAQDRFRSGVLVADADTGEDLSRLYVVMADEEAGLIERYVDDGPPGGPPRFRVDPATGGLVTVTERRRVRILPPPDRG